MTLSIVTVTAGEETNLLRNIDGTFFTIEGTQAAAQINSVMAFNEGSVATTLEVVANTPSASGVVLFAMGMPANRIPYQYDLTEIRTQTGRNPTIRAVASGSNIDFRAVVDYDIL